MGFEPGTVSVVRCHMRSPLSRYPVPLTHTQRDFDFDFDILFDGHFGPFEGGVKYNFAISGFITQHHWSMNSKISHQILQRKDQSQSMKFSWTPNKYCSVWSTVTVL